MVSDFLAVLIASTAAAGLASAAALALGRSAATAATLAVGLGWVGAHLAVRGVPGLPPLDVTDRFAFVAAGATAAVLLESARAVGPRSRPALGLILACLALGLILGPLTEHAWTPRQSAAWFLGLGGILMAARANLEAVSARLPAGAALVILLGMALVMAAVQAAFSGSLVLGLLALGGAGPVAVATARPGHSTGSGRGAAGVALVCLATLGGIGHLYGNLAWAPALLILAAPAGAWPALAGPARSMPGPARWCLGVAGVVIPLGAATCLAYAGAPDGVGMVHEGSGKVQAPMGQRIVQVDAFTDQPFRGNPAAVCVRESPAEEPWMQAVASELNLSETAFLHPEGPPGTYRLRWFTPKLEVDLCGHATLASAHVLWLDGHLDPDRPARFLTRSGVLSAVNRSPWIELDFPSTPAVAEAPHPGLAEALGASPAWVGRTRHDWLIELASADAVRALRPDPTRLKAIPSRGFIVTALSDDRRFDFVSRFFAPGAGIEEDPVTGSAHCALTPYWSARLKKSELIGQQVSSRGGTVRVGMHGDRVSLGGQAVTVMRSELSEPATAGA